MSEQLNGAVDLISERTRSLEELEERNTVGKAANNIRFVDGMEYMKKGGANISNSSVKNRIYRKLQTKPPLNGSRLEIESSSC